MKNFLIGVFVLLITVSCNQDKNPTADDDAYQQRANSLAATLYTLNGIPFDDADKMVKEFQKDSLSSDPKTNVWFSKKYIDEICTILDTGGRDGIRIYFARRGDGGNTVVVVSTKNNGVYGSPSKDRHKDYFDHSIPFLNTMEARNTDDYGTNPGARLYKTLLACPPQNCPESDNRIDCTDARKWVNDFKNKATDKFKTKAVWFSKTLLDNIKSELGRSSGGSGIRIYFVLKPSGKHNLVIVTTKTSGSRHDDDYQCPVSIVGVNDNGEECPNNCGEEGDATWD